MMVAATGDVRRDVVEISERRLERARAAVADLAAELDLERRLAPYADRRWDGRLERPMLHLDDVSAIPFLNDIVGIEQYQHRARTRARDGDLFAAVTPLTAGYESYCRDRLRLGRVELVVAEPVAEPIAVADSCARGKAFDRLTASARAAGGLILHPYMGIEPVWDLARRLGEASGVPVKVLGPPPPVTWVANDKGSLCELVRRVLGEEFLVETHTTHSAARMGELLLDLAGRHAQVALKRLRCASGMGNAIFESEHVVALDRETLAGDVRAFLERTEWDGRQEVQVVAWEATDISPSTQLWIPPLGAGPPHLDGIYEQLLEDRERVFLGSRPSRLPAAVDRRLATAGLELAAGLQALGYAGRCSFDYLLVGDPEGEYRLRVVECNGRWGGTSTPMSLLDRLVQAPRPPHRSQDFVAPELRGMTFPELLDRVGDEVYDPATGRGRYVFYNVGPLARDGKLDVIALGSSQEEAEAALMDELPRLLGL